MIAPFRSGFFFRRIWPAKGAFLVNAFWRIQKIVIKKDTHLSNKLIKSGIIKWDKYEE